MATDWSPDLPLRADATGEQINERHDFLYEQGGKRVGYEFNEMDIVSDEVEHQVACELVSAVSEEKDRDIAKLQCDLSHASLVANGFQIKCGQLETACEEKDAEIARLTAQLAAYEQNHGWVSAEIFAAVRKNNEQKEGEIARLRKDAERLDGLADLLQSGDAVTLKREQWEEGCTVDISVESANRFHGSEPMASTLDALCAAIDSAKEAK